MLKKKYKKAKELFDEGCVRLVDESDKAVYYEVDCPYRKWVELNRDGFECFGCRDIVSKLKTPDVVLKCAICANKYRLTKGLVVQHHLKSCVVETVEIWYKDRNDKNSMECRSCSCIFGSTQGIPNGLDCSHIIAVLLDLCGVQRKGG